MTFYILRLYTTSNSNMKTAISFFIILSFAGVAIFGFMAMNSHSTGCIAETASGRGMPCPSHDAAGFLEFHLNAFKAFSLAIFEKSVINVLDVLIVLFVGVAFITRRKFVPVFERTFYAFRKRIREQISFYKEQFIHWLCLFELSPSFLSKPPA